MDDFNVGDITKKFIEILYSIFQGDLETTSILLAVSGGVDSIAMLDLFDSLRNELKYNIAVATFNHKLRKEADEEAKFVENLCKERNLPFFTDQADVLRYSRTNKLSIEESARILRYKFLTEVADKYSYKYIATAHNANDLLETMILRLAKGTGPYGLVGMTPINGRFIKPLLIFSRKEIEDYIAYKRLSFVTDASNFDIKYNRNFIRHKIIPLFREINPSVESASLRLAHSIWELDEYINSLVRSYNDKHLIKLGEYIIFKLHEDSYIQIEQIRRNALSFFGKPIDSEKLERFKKAQKSGKASYKISFWKDLGIEISRGWCIMGKINEYPHFSKTISILKETAQTVEIDINGYLLKISNCDIIENMGNKHDKSVIFEARNWLEGDRLISGKKVKELFIEKKVPTFVKHMIPLVISIEENKVIYIPYLYEPREHIKKLGIRIETKGGFYFES